ncbi:MAG: PUA domain-containing protein [Candidatus Heimdallarchaeota archaeon]
MSNKFAKTPDEWTLQQLRKIAQYQFGDEFAAILVPDDVTITISKKTKKVREVLLGENRIATIRPTDGYFSIGLFGAQRIIAATKSPKLRVVVQNDISEFIIEGRNVFAKHVIKVDSNIHPEDEVIVVNEKDKLLAIGKAQLSAEYMLAFEKGIAVKVRYGAKKLNKK